MCSHCVGGNQPSGEPKQHKTKEEVCCRYMGEWYDTSEEDHAPYAEQKANAMHNCWVVAGIYLGFAVLSGLGTCYFSIKAKRS